MDFEAGQQWRYRAPEEIPGSRIVIGALLDFESGPSIACCAVTAASGGQGASGGIVTIPFLPMTVDALKRTVTEVDGTADVPEGFVEQLEAWRGDPRGLSYFTVPFEGSLDRMIGHQMAAIVEQT